MLFHSSINNQRDIEMLKKRSADGLLKAAKRMAQENPAECANEQQRSTSDVIVRALETQNSQTAQQLSLQDEEIRIIENKRIHKTPEYVKLSPSEFMTWWITSTGAKRKASSVLLKYIKFKFDVDIPKDYRTLLKTPAKSVPKFITPGAYIHLGVSQALNYSLSSVEPISSKEILLQFFVDGLSIPRSTKDEAWIIMMNVRNASKRRLIPKVIGVYYGEGKPLSFNEFLWPFVMELLTLMENGFVLNGEVLKLKILNFVLDAPSRTSCKCITHINGYFGCDYCLAEGDCIDHRMAFLDLEAPLRNDFDYRARIYDDYHHTESVLELLPIDMIDAFPPDYLHCGLLGAMYWMLKYLRDTPKTLSSMDHIKIKRRVEIFRQTQPVEFQRKLRSFVENLGFLKGTEFRQHLLFVYPLLLQGIVSEEMIDNFLKLHIASIIFSHKRFECYYKEADELMKMFVQEFAEVYDPRHVTYVFHALCHMKKFVDLYGPWDNFSTFEYESYNSTVKNLLQGNVMPLTQITNRIVEIYNSPKHDFAVESLDIEIKGRQDNGTFEQLKYYDLTFNTNHFGQNYVLLKSGQAVKLISISYDLSKVKLTGMPFKYHSSVYSIVDSRRFNIFKSKQEFDPLVTFGVSDIDGKMWELNIDDSSMSAYYPLYVEDGKSFSRDYNNEN